MIFFVGLKFSFPIIEGIINKTTCFQIEHHTKALMTFETHVPKLKKTNLCGFKI